MLCQGRQFARSPVRYRIIYVLRLHEPLLTVSPDSMVTLYPLPGFSPPTPLTKSKQALSIATFTGVVRIDSDGKAIGAPNDAKDVPSVVTHLAIGCKRKIVIYSWKDGEPQEPQVHTMHSAMPAGLNKSSRRA